MGTLIEKWLWLILLTPHELDFLFQTFELWLLFPSDSCVASSSASPPVSAARLPPVSSSTNYASSSSSLHSDQSSGLSLSRFLVSVSTLITVTFTVNLTVLALGSFDCVTFFKFFPFFHAHHVALLGGRGVYSYCSTGKLPGGSVEGPV